MSLTIKGTLEKILNPESGISRSGKEWKKQEFIVETKEQFPRKICFTLFNEKLSLIDQFSEGSEIEVSFNLESREYNSKWFHNVNAWKIEEISDKIPEHTPPPEYSESEIPPELNDNEEDSLPF